MINRANVVILIVAHKPFLSPNEGASLKQCYKILGKYPIRIICPKGLNIQEYRALIPDIEVDFIDPKWQATYAMFNRLKIAPFLYNRYCDYEYILFYELDAWVFRDELEYWCNLGYDYIGAPWYEGYGQAEDNSPFIGVGNGGFSLRKVNSHLKVLSSFSYLEKPSEFMRGYDKKLNVKNLIKILLNFTIRNNTYYMFNNCHKHEDYFWGNIVKRNFKWFRIPTEDIASQFATEKKAKINYRINNNILPFGCHGWLKYEPEFWKDHINLSDV
ncbi:hypothetical protein FYC62_00590 [Pedobacter aquae]|uniref:DUF5672 domain-containing protein n=1 Tax=Pedobacter aquae TaxID=2605747 RepID=A0A5C0VE42_9SPHI|nr:DUF5672 family protein [Pedobacter aquae]QEK50329.1 hypothetical protein FYC62_00590 [Pedobacter aquae]